MTAERILILSPHTDDAELGCGGLITKLLDEGKKIFWVVFSAAEDSLPPELSPDTLVTEFKSVADYLKLSENDYKINNFKVRNLHEKRQEILEIMVSLRKTFNPELVIGPSLNDFHQDHQVVSNEMIRAFKMSCSIICYELPWNHINFQSQYFVKLEEKHIQKKVELLNFYKSQFIVKRHYFSEDFIRGLALTRGAQVGHKYAEAFDVIRWIEQ